jgi:hypothetical protein
MSVGAGTVPPREGHRPAGSAWRVVVGRGADGPARTDARAPGARPDGAMPRVPHPQDTLDPHIRHAVPGLGGPARRAAARGGSPDGRTGEDRHASSWGPSRPRMRVGGRPASPRHAEDWIRRAVRKGRRGSRRRWPGRPVPSPPAEPGRPIGPKPEGPPALAGWARARRSPGTPAAPACHFIGESPSRLKRLRRATGGSYTSGAAPGPGAGVPQAPGAPIV